MSRPNVLWIVWDTVRRDALEPYGAPAGRTPVVADLARRGIAAPSVRSTSCWTMPSHVAMFAGVLPREVGLTQAPTRTPASCREPLEGMRDRLVAEVFRRAGYGTNCASGNLWIDRSAGFDIGFERFAAHTGHRTARMASTKPRDRLRWLAQAARARADDGARQLLDTLLQWQRESDGRPSFTFVNNADCHSPYLPPRPYAIGPVGRMRAADEARRHLTLDQVWTACLGGPLPSDGALQRMREQYAGEVRYTDAWTGSVLEGLDAAGVLDDTLVVVTSDHGENFGENGLMAHAFSVDDRLVHVPLVAAGPGAERLAGLQTLADLPLALCEIAGIEGHPYETVAPEGISVAQWDPPSTGESSAVDEYLAHAGLDSDPEARLRLTESLTSAVRGTTKLVRRGDREQLFDLATDPGEEHPLAPEAGDDAEVAALRRALERGEQRAEVAAAPAQASAEELAEIEARMEMLGYL